MPWIRTPTLSTHTHLVAQLFTAHGLEVPEPAVSADDETVITSLVVAGLGVALVRDEVARARAAEGELVVWPGAAIETTLWFVCPAARIEVRRGAAYARGRDRNLPEAVASAHIVAALPPHA